MEKKIFLKSKIERRKTGRQRLAPKIFLYVWLFAPKKKKFFVCIVLLIVRRQKEKFERTVWCQKIEW
ncbi:hypothetical protein Mgra_00007645, partial [Meloidogyne graminicola]